MRGCSPPTAPGSGRRRADGRSRGRRRPSCSRACRSPGATRATNEDRTMDLILWRHADAEPGVPDAARRLTPKGERQAEKMGAWLDRHLPEDTRILVSPAVRAQQTALGLGRKFRTVEEVAPGASAAAVLAAAGWPGGRETVLVVGHQPTLGEVAALLL